MSYKVIERMCAPVDRAQLMAASVSLFGPWLAHATVSAPGQIAGTQSPVVEPYSALRDSHVTERRFRDGATVRSTPEAGWACAALSYWVELAQASSKFPGHQGSLDHPSLFEVETALRYAGTGLTPLDETELPNGKRSEFAVQLGLHAPLHVECKLAHSLLTADEAVALADQFSFLELLEAPILRSIPQELAGIVAVRLSGDRPELPEVLDAVREAISPSARPAPDASEGPWPVTAASRTWGTVDIVRLPGWLSGGASAWSQLLIEHGIHETDGFSHVRYTMDGAPRLPGELMAFPRQVVIAVGPTSMRSMDTLLKRQFEKSRGKLRGTSARLIAHLRLHVPEVLGDSVPPWMDVRRGGWMKAAGRRIRGLMSQAPPGLVGVEITSLEWTGSGDADAGWREHVLFLPNDHDETNSAILAKLRETVLTDRE